MKFTTNISSIPTLYNKCDGGLLEYVLCVNNRPFGFVSSPSLPVPATSMMDFSLVQKLGIPTEGVGSPDDRQPEGVRGLDDAHHDEVGVLNAQCEGVGGQADVRQEVGALV